MKQITILTFWLIQLSLCGQLFGQNRVLFVVSNATHYGNSEIRTANHFGEIVYAYDEFVKAGFHVDIVSPEGGSIAIGYLNSDSLLQFYLYNPAFMGLLERTKHPDEIQSNDYEAVYYSGGGAAMFGTFDNNKLKQISADIYEHDGFVAAVCHGTAGIVDIKLSDGQFLVWDKRVNGFPDLFENKEAAYFQQFPFSIQEQIVSNGGMFSYSKDGWDGFLEIDGRLITGQDPTSARGVAKAVIEAVNESKKSAVANDDIDEIFAPFNRKDHPAVATVAIHKGQVVYQKAFGSTELDNFTPATIDTKFQLGGLSKQFTAFALLLLEEQGKISLSDNIRNYLPELPEYPATITMDHLMTMTSGLPDFWTLKNIAGWHRDDVFTQEHAMELIKNCQPGFAPGTDYIYSNTDLLLMAEIVSKVSGKSFASFMNDEIFSPLGMTNTLVKDDFEQYISNLAESYEASEEGFRPSPLNYGIVGPTNVYSTVADLAKWELNLIDPKIGSSELVKKLYTRSTLKNGSTMNPLFGTLTYGQQLYHKERGLVESYQTGTLGGYASAIFKFMDQDFSIIVLSSGIPYSGYLGMHTAYLFLEDQFTEPQTIDYAALPTQKFNKRKLEKHEGTYWINRSGYSRTIAIENDTLRYVRGDGRSSALLPLTENTFQMYIPGDEHILVSFRGKGANRQMNFVIGESDPIVGKAISRNTSNENLEAYTGTYYCPTLNVVYEVAKKDGKLTASNLRAGEVVLTAVEPGLFEGNRWFFGGIKFDADGRGFTLNIEEVRGLRFDKLSNQVYGL
ncbi:MAG: serine hydrolase [Cytophagales bacterium]|nr:serine hydrolase [Cytophagales bacterium]